MGGLLARREWKRRSRVAQPVFIVGDARSGTTLLYRSLQSHPAFRPPGGLHLVESHAMERLPEVTGTAPVPPDPLLVFMMGQEPFARFVADVAHLDRRRSVARRFVPKQPASLPVWVAAGEHHVTRRYFLGATESRGAERLAEKTPQHVQWVRHLRFAFPQARFLFVVRHPVDILASYWRRYEVDPDGSPWADVDLVQFCTRWRTNTRAAQRLAQARGSGLLMVRYEDLTGRTEPTIRSILAHVGEPFHEGCLLREADTDGSSWIDPHLFEPVVSRTKDWTEYVDVDQARRLEEMLGPDLGSAGYERYTC